MSYREIADVIFNQIELLKKYKDLFTDEEYLNIKSIQFEIALKAGDFESDIELKVYELCLRPFFARVWESQLTDPNLYKAAEDFKFVICNPSKINNYVISANLITNKYKKNSGELNYGLVCSVDESNLIMALSEQHNLHLIKSSSLTARYYSLIYDFGDMFLMSKDYLMGIKLLSQIEEEIKEGQDNDSFIILDTDKTEFKKVVLFEPYNEDDFNEAMELASQYNLEVLTISSITYSNNPDSYVKTI